ncbi:Elongation factor 1-beta 1, partial [Linum perenne]
RNRICGGAKGIRVFPYLTYIYSFRSSENSLSSSFQTTIRSLHRAVLTLYRSSSTIMAVSFSDLHTEAGLKALDAFLSGKSYISGGKFTKDDVKVYAAVQGKPSDSFPNASKWYNAVSSHLASSFPGKAAGVGVGGAAASSSAKELKAPAASGGDDDDLDLFGDETEDEKKAAEEREKAKSSTKKKESGIVVGGKSSVLLDVKPWDDETDMKKLEEAVRSIEMPGLFWGASKLVTVGYGIKKLQIMMTIVDDLVSVDDLVDEYLTVEPRNEYIQSCDIVAFNKI